MLSIHDPLLIFTDLDGTLLNSHTFGGSRGSLAYTPA